MSDETTSQTTFIPGKNGGRLRNGGTNRGGPGRPKDKVREACALAFEQRIPVLKKIADAKIADVSVEQRLKALDLLGKYGGLQKVETETKDTTLADLMREAAAGDDDGTE
jgi:hypothetical protein